MITHFSTVIGEDDEAEVYADNPPTPRQVLIIIWKKLCTKTTKPEFLEMMQIQMLSVARLYLHKRKAKAAGMK